MDFISDKMIENKELSNIDYSVLFNQLKETVENTESNAEPTENHVSAALSAINNSEFFDIDVFRKASYNDLSRSFDILTDLNSFLLSTGVDAENIALDKVPNELLKFFEIYKGKDLVKRFTSCKEKRSNKRVLISKTKGKAFF